MQARLPPVTNAFKLVERRKNEWRCLLCCHVRTGTIFLGLWHLILQLVALSTCILFWNHPDFLTPIHMTKTSIIERDELPTALAERNMPSIHMNSFSTDAPAIANFGQDDAIETTVGGSANNDNYYASYGMFIGRSLRYEEINCAIIVLLCTLFLTISMIYGAIKGKPKLLIPFFCLQVFDLFVTIFSALGYLCYLPDLHRIMIRTESEYIPSSVTSISPQYVSFIVILSLTVSIISKAYFVAVVWSCYKYLTLKQASAQPAIHYIESNFVVQNLLRPDCDFNMKKFPPPPPSYAVAVTRDGLPEAQPPPYSSN